jgi:hypothetical protein
MNLANNPRGTAAVPNGKGGIRFVPHAETPQDRPWGCFHVVSDDGPPTYARGPQPAPGAVIHDWLPDDPGAPRVVGVADTQAAHMQHAAPAPTRSARRPAPPPEPGSLLRQYDAARAAKAALAALMAPPARARAPATDLQLQAGTGGIDPTNTGTGGPAESAEGQWAASRARVAARPTSLREL